MKGNDIVDLKQAVKDSNWQRKGWLDKLFTTEEQRIIMQSPAIEKTIWLMWSMKEAAYKISNRASGIMSFAPKKFICHLFVTDQEEARGMVCFQQEKYFTQSKISDNYIHTIALPNNNFDAINVYIITGQNKQLQALRDYTFIKNDLGIPFLRHISGHVQDVSKSHHGRYEAVVF